MSPTEQRAVIEEWANRTVTQIIEWHEDLDYSGGTLERPASKKRLDVAAPV